MSHLLYESALLLIICGLLFYYTLKRQYGYWKKLHVPYIKPTYIVGNLSSLLSLRCSSAEFIRDNLYNHADAINKPFVGIYLFHQPALLMRDPELVKRVLIRDFGKFSNRYSNADANIDALGSLNVFFLKNPFWKDVRLKLTPFFSSGRLKQMFYLMEEIGRQLESYLLRQPFQNADAQCFELELKEFCALYTTDVIASVAYGVEANTLKSNPNGEFRRNGREVFRFNLKRGIEFMIIFFLPNWVSLFGIRVVPPKVSKFIRSTVKYVMAEREKSGHKRNDLIDILIEFKNSTKKENACDPSRFVFDGDILVAQAAIFFTAGFETSSATMSFALYELAKHTDLQERLREEIRKGLIESEGKVTHQLIDSLEYMGMVIAETLRLYPPLPFLDRECTISEEIQYNLEPYNDFKLPPGMPVYVPVYGLHMDPKYFPQPEIFDPERFSPENRKFITPYTYMPFGLGPHGCIGERYSMMQIKIGLVYFLRNHYVTTCKRTQIPMRFDPKSIIIQARGGIYLNVVRDPLNIE